MKLTTRLVPLFLLSFLSAPPAFAQDETADAPAPVATEGVDATDATTDALQLPPMMLRLRTGGILWGSIVEHTPEWVRFQRVDSGGIVRLPWVRLDPAEEEDLRLRFGYVDAAADEIMVTVDRFPLRDGTEITGLIESRTDQYIFVKTAVSTIPVPKTQVAGPSTRVQVPALEIYTRGELYQQKVLEMQADLLAEGEVGAQANYEVADYCERLFDYEHAAHHYRRTAELDPLFETEAVLIAISRSETKAEKQEQVDMIAQIDLYRARKRYDLAVELIQQFPVLFPDSPLMEDFRKMQDRVAKYQERDLRAETVRLWHNWTKKLTGQAVREHKTYEAVLAYIEDGLVEDLRQGVVEDLQRLAPGIEPDEMQQFWDEREGGRRRQATYGLGTWLLGEDRALANIEPQEEKKKPAEKGSQDEARQKLEDRIKRYLDNQELARKAKAGGESEDDDPEKFWAGWNWSGRSLWTLAYFVENSGLFRLEKVLFNNCRGCGGKGVREVIFTGSAVSGDAGGNSRLFRCATCRGIARTRRIKYR